MICLEVLPKNTFDCKAVVSGIIFADRAVSIEDHGLSAIALRRIKKSFWFVIQSDSFN